MKTKHATDDEIKAIAKGRLDNDLRNVYSVDEEFRIINLGIASKKNPEYIEYRATIDALVGNYRNELKGTK